MNSNPTAAPEDLATTNNLLRQAAVSYLVDTVCFGCALGAVLDVGSVCLAAPETIFYIRHRFLLFAKHRSSLKLQLLSQLPTTQRLH